MDITEIGHPNSPDNALAAAGLLVHCSPLDKPVAMQVDGEIQPLRSNEYGRLNIRDVLDFFGAAGGDASMNTHTKSSPLTS